MGCGQALGTPLPDLAEEVPALQDAKAPVARLPERRPRVGEGSDLLHVLGGEGRVELDPVPEEPLGRPCCLQSP